MGLINDIKNVGKEINASVLGNTFAKGDLFEVLVQRLLPDSEFVIVHATTRRDDLDGRKIESAKNPDFKVRHRRTNHEFWVECKYRGETYHDKIQWCEHWQLDRYRRFQEENRPEKVYVAIGLGGRASDPDHLYCIPLDEAKYPGLFVSTLRPFEHDIRRPFEYTSGRLK